MQHNFKKSAAYKLPVLIYVLFLKNTKSRCTNHPCKTKKTHHLPASIPLSSLVLTCVEKMRPIETGSKRLPVFPL